MAEDPKTMSGTETVSRRELGQVLDYARNTHEKVISMEGLLGRVVESGEKTASGIIELATVTKARLDFDQEQADRVEASRVLKVKQETEAARVKAESDRQWRVAVGTFFREQWEKYGQLAIALTFVLLLFMVNSDAGNKVLDAGMDFVGLSEVEAQATAAEVAPVSVPAPVVAPTPAPESAEP